jgi:multidrug efflux pump subunit AcrB
VNLAQVAVERKTISWMFVVILGVGGLLSFLQLGRLEFPEFTINQALVVTSYPGASPEQVEAEVTAKLEEVIQQLPLLDYVTSTNSAGLSQITVVILDSTRSWQYTQVWDELRRKISDAQIALPEGAQPSLVIDDFGDVFGLYLAISGTGYTSADLNDYAKSLRRELVLMPGVKKVVIDGVQEEQVFIEISRERLSNLGISQQTIQDLLTDQNIVSNAGELQLGTLSIRVHPTGEYTDVNELETLVVNEPGSSRLTYLGDIATITRGFAKQPSKIYRTDGDEALTIGVSFLANINVVDVGNTLRDKIIELENERPVGMNIQTIYDQSMVVDKSVTDFLITLAQAIAIVFVVLVLFMGLRSGALMGVILLLTISGTFIVMAQLQINLQIISLGALVIALGMLVDNAIVVTEGMMIGVRRGLTKIEAAKLVVTQNQWPLLGATVIAITAFAPIGLSSGASGEFAGSLFWVLLIALSISWILAMTLTPFFFILFFKESESVAEENEMYNGFIFTLYKNILSVCLRNRTVTLFGVLLALVVGIVAFGNVKQSFFPPSATPIYLVDYWLPEGTDITATAASAKSVAKGLLAFTETSQVTTVIGGGAQRFVLSYTPEQQFASYAQFIVLVTNPEDLNAALIKTAQWLRINYPEAETRVKPMSNGPSATASVEARFFGDDPKVLRDLAGKAAHIFELNKATDAIRVSWRNQVTIVRPQFIDDAARRAGISKSSLDEAIQMTFSGRQIGTYRDGVKLMPIVLRAPESERENVNSLREMQIWSPEYKTYVPIMQVVSSFDVVNEDPLLIRRDRKRTISVYAEPLLLSGDTAMSVLEGVRAEVESIPLPAGYSMSWGGEYEESNKASGAIFSTIPLGLLGMFITTVLLFNNMREPIVIWLTVPLAVIGAAFGLLVTGQHFGFMALLGMLSLVGMLLKNGIVLVEQIRLETNTGKELYNAIFGASVSRVRPVMMAALTTMLGMVPLMFDAFFASMAVTIIFGLGFASIVTLIVLPVLYSLFYNAKPLVEDAA